MSAIVDSDERRARSAALDYGIERWFRDPLQMLAETKPQAVSVVTSPSFHLELTRQSVSSGAAVLLEKPILRDTRQAKELLRIAQGGLVMPGHVLRFMPEHLELKRAIGNRPVVGLFARRNRDRGHSTRFPTEHPAFLSLIHDIDQAMWLGEDYGAEVTAFGRTVIRDDLPDAIFARVLSQSGQVWDMHSTWLAEDDQGFSSRIEVHTRDGSLALEVGSDSTPAYGGLLAELAEFIDCVRSNRPSSRITVPDALHGIAIAEAITESAQQDGKRIRVKPITS